MLLGRAAPGPFERAHCMVRREVTGGAITYSVAFDTPLGRRDLMDVLYALAPYKAHGPDRFGRVLDNWAIFDRAKTGGGASSNLFEQHARSLGSNWRVFGEHRDVFVAAFADADGSFKVLPWVAWQTDASGKRRWLPDAKIEHVPADLRPDALTRSWGS
jgi:hypothetical protein